VQAWSSKQDVTLESNNAEKQMIIGETSHEEALYKLRVRAQARQGPRQNLALLIILLACCNNNVKQTIVGETTNEGALYKLSLKHIAENLRKPSRGRTRTLS